MGMKGIVYRADGSFETLLWEAMRAG
jgi:hypothetical protein